MGDKLISVDGKKISELDLNWYESRDLASFFEDNQKVKFQFETKNIELFKKEKSLFAPFSDFYLYSIDIDEKSKKLNARIHIESSHQFDEEDQQYQLSKTYLWHDKREDVNKDTISCSFSLNEWEKENFSVPGVSYFLNLHSIDLDTFEENLTLKPYTHEIEWHKENRWNNELNVEYTYTGNYLFNTNFNYKNFPFDKQIIKFELVNLFDLGSGLLDVSHRSIFKLEEFASKNSISGWEIINSGIYHDTYRDPTVIDPSDVLVIELEIERQHGYYVYKVILPIILILMVCWSSVFIAAKELESKLTITIVCLLSLIAYNFVIDNEIPKLEYLTIIDWIILASYFYAALPNFQLGFLGRLKELILHLKYPFLGHIQFQLIQFSFLHNYCKISFHKQAIYHNFHQHFLITHLIFHNFRLFFSRNFQLFVFHLYLLILTLQLKYY